jgi:hypothetical protein
MWLTLSQKCPSIKLPWNTFTDLILQVKKNLGKSTKINIIPVFLSSNFMMHSSPLLTTLSAPSHAHLLTFHSSALDFTTSVIDYSHGTKSVSQLILRREGTSPIMKRTAHMVSEWTKKQPRIGETWQPLANSNFQETLLILSSLLIQTERTTLQLLKS